MMRRLAISVLMLCLSLAAAAQVVPFVTVRMSARQLALGGAHAADPEPLDSAATVFEAAVSKVLWQKSAIDYNLTDYRAGAWIARSLRLGLDITTNNMGEMVTYSDNGQPLGTFQPSELMAAIDVCYKPSGKIAILAAGKMIRSSLADNYSARAYAIDIEGRWKVSKNIYTGFAVNNLGQAIGYGYGSYPLPTTYKAGLYGIFGGTHAVEGAADFGAMPAWSTFLASVGAGYVYNGRLALRLGAHISTKAEVLPTYASVGASFLSENFDIGAAYLTAANSFALSVKIRL